MTEFAAEVERLMRARQMGLRELARTAHYDPGHLSRVLRGIKPPSAKLSQDLDELFSCGGTLTALALLAGPRVRTPEAVCDDEPDGGTTRVPCRIPDGRIIFVTVSRRALVQNAGLAALAVAGVPLAGADAGPPDRRFLARREAMMQLDNAVGPVDVIPVAAGQVTLMRQLWPSLAGADLRRLILVQVQFADLLGWLHQDIGEYTAARYWLDRALEWAHITADSDSAAFILARKAQLAGDMHDPAGAITVAEAAIRHASPGSRISAAATTYAAYGYALAGDRAACDRLCDQARTAAGADTAEPGPWALFMDQPYIDVHQARSHAALHDYRTAADRFRAAISQLQPLYYRDRGVYLAREAAAHAGTGEAEHAAALGLQALSIGAETRSGRILTELAHLGRALAPARSSPSVSEFLTAVDAAIPAAVPGRKAGHR